MVNNELAELSPGEAIIVRKGKDLVWQNPRKDKQSIVQMARISPRNGYTDTGYVGWDIVECPLEKGYFHFYQLGDNYPGDFTLIARKNQWYRLSEWCKVIDLVIHLYDKHGKLIPLHDAYTIRLYNDNIIIAVKINTFVTDLNDETLYMHFYKNDFYSHPELKDSQDAHIEYFTNTYSQKTPTSELFKLYSAISRRPRGKFRLTHNGYLVDHVNTDKLEHGEVTELHYDMSVRKIVDFPINKLRTFKSVLDGKNKYLLHPPKDGVNIIDYRDDLDIFVCKRDKKTKHFKGVYYHHNLEDSVRMVTHRDWSLPVPYVMSLVEYLDPHPDLNDFFIRVYVRDNGPITPLIDDCNMINGLYVLPDDKIVEAMVQVDSVVPEWQAANLEQSAYTALMRSYREEITPALVLDALGYSSTVKSLANPNVRLTKEVNGDYFKLPVGVYKTATIFEYNKHGLLLGWYHQDGLSKYYPRNPSCIFIEVYAGHGGDEINQHIGNRQFELEVETAYRFYLAKTTGGDKPEKASNWQDATGDKRILVDGTKCTFAHENTNEIGIAIGDNKWLCYDLNLDGTDGILDFTLTHGFEHLTPLIIPPGKIDLFMNGHALVENIDYFIDFPKVMVVCKKWMQDNALQKVTVRCMGFPFQYKGHLVRLRPREVGFIQYGNISVDAHYDIHNEKVLRTVVNGGVYDPAVIPFDENGDSNVSRFMKDGGPYAVELPYISLQGTLGISVYQSQLKDYDLTLRAGDYITMHLPKVPRKLPPVIDDKYEVYSPFLSKIATDLRYGRLKSPLPSIAINTVDKIIEKYKPYLAMDPCIRGFNKHFVNVHGHNLKTYMELSARDIAFLERLSHLYLRNHVDVSKFFKVRNSK